MSASGHRAVVHGRRIGSRTLIGTGAVVLDDCEIGSHCIIAAAALLPPKSVIPDGVVVMGAPGRVVREVSEDDLATIDHVVQSLPDDGPVAFRGALSEYRRSLSESPVKEDALCRWNYRRFPSPPGGGRGGTSSGRAFCSRGGGYKYRTEFPIAPNPEMGHAIRRQAGGLRCGRVAHGFSRGGSPCCGLSGKSRLEACVTVDPGQGAEPRAG